MTTRREQLAKIQVELEDARRRAHEVPATLSADAWSARPSANHWSVGECLVHLNLTSRAFVPLLRKAIADGHAAAPEGREATPSASTPYRMDVRGRLVWWGTRLRLPIRTTEAFVPPRVAGSDTVLVEFDRLQREVTECVDAAGGLDLDTLRIVSPFDARLRYNLYSAFRLIPAHQRLHLGQAERVIRVLARR